MFGLWDLFVFVFGFGFVTILDFGFKTCTKIGQKPKLKSSYTIASYLLNSGYKNNCLCLGG